MHYYFYIRDESLGPIVIRVATFLPFQATYYLNGHSYMERELKRFQVAHRKDDNAFLACADPAALQAAADRLTPEVIRKSLDYWTLIVGPKFSKREQKAMNVRRAYYIHQIEYCRNFIFKRNFPIHKIFERSCDLALWRMTAHKISEMFGVRLTKQFKGKLNTVIDQMEHATTCSAPIGSRHSSNSTRSSQPICEMRSAATTCRTSVSKRASTTCPPFERSFWKSPIASPGFRPSVSRVYGEKVTV